jgi:hypothetical protein
MTAKTPAGKGRGWSQDAYPGFALGPWQVQGHAGPTIRLTRLLLCGKTNGLSAICREKPSMVQQQIHADSGIRLVPLP